MTRTIGLLCCLLLVGCSTPGGNPALQRVDPNSIYARAGVQFQEAVLFKPIEPATTDLLFTLAPLIILQVSETNLPPQVEDRLLGFDAIAERPVVYAWSDSVQVRGRPHARFNYVWDHGPAVNAKPKANERQGVRITLGSKGQPLIWEVLGDTSGQELIVVSESLEQRAAAEFGAPLPGRRFSVENPTSTAPNTLVMRVIDDGPVVMGPIIYLLKGSRDVATIICRCMPAQAGHLAGTFNYQLLSHPAANTAWPGSPLETRLRLPEF